MSHRYIGESVPRRGLDELVRGRASYVADHDVPGQLHARVVRASVAHATIVGIDVERARSMPGVVGVFTARDLPPTVIPIRLSFADTPRARLALQTPLALDRIRYVGEPVALVVATDPWRAEDAAAEVTVDFTELDPVVDLRRAAEPDAEVLHPALGDNRVHADLLVHGDVDAAFAAAAHVVDAELALGRHAGVPMETRGLLAEPEPDGALTLWGAAKVKHYNRNLLAELLDVPPDRLRLVEGAVGGGFGVRGEFYPEDFLIPWAAKRLGRPVKWIEDRIEHLVAANHSREHVQRLSIAVGADGELLAFRAQGLHDQGAYVRTQGLLPTVLPVLHLPGPYAWRAFSIEATGVMTNRTPMGTYRGPGATEATFARERALDRVAAVIGMDPVELRERNLITGSRMPWSFGLGGERPPIGYDLGSPREDFARIVEAADLSGLVARRDALRAEGRRAGIGVGVFMEAAGIGPYEEVVLEHEPGTGIVVRCGTSSLGQGVETVLAQIAATELDVDLDGVVVRFHDTRTVAMGFGAFASRSTLLCGNAIVLAAAALREQAAARLGVAAGDVTIDPVAGQATDGDGRSVALADLGPVSGRFEKAAPSFAFGGAVSLVEVDDGTGHVRVLAHLVAADVGRAINPALLEGQLRGAAAQGIGGALFEELRFDDEGQPLSTTFADYMIPTATELPRVDTLILETPVEGTPLLAKGGGEAGMPGTPAAVANAVADALGAAGQDVTFTPLLPARVAALLAAAEEAGAPAMAPGA